MLLYLIWIAVSAHRNVGGWHWHCSNATSDTRNFSQWGWWNFHSLGLLQSKICWHLDERHTWWNESFLEFLSAVYCNKGEWILIIISWQCMCTCIRTSLYLQHPSPIQNAYTVLSSYLLILLRAQGRSWLGDSNYIGTKCGWRCRIIDLWKFGLSTEVIAKPTSCVLILCHSDYTKG